MFMRVLAPSYYFSHHSSDLIFPYGKQTRTGITGSSRKRTGPRTVGFRAHTEGNGDLSPSVVLSARISRVTRERWAQTGITIQFLIVVRTLGEFFRLRHVLGTNLSAAVTGPYVDGALIAACFCWASVT